MDNLTMEFGTRIGYDLGRLQFLPEDSKLPLTLKKREEIIDSLSRLLKIDEIDDLFDNTFEILASNILDYYRYKDVIKFAGVILGISVVEIVLSRNQSKEIADQFISIAKGKINLIPNDILSTEQKNNTILQALRIRNLDFNHLSKLLNDILFNSSSFSDEMLDSNCKYVFISYCGQEHSKANAIRRTLENAGIKVWMAPDSIPASADYGECIPAAIANCAAFVLILSEKSQKSKWVPKELDCAIANDRIIIPFHTDNSQLNNKFNFRLIDVQRIDAFDNYNKACLSLIQSIQRILDL